MKIYPPAHEPDALADGEGLLFWYGATHIARAENSRRYRLENRLDQLPGARAFVGRDLSERALEGIDRVLVVRPFVDGPARRQLDALRRRGCRLWADYDDLLFDGELEQFPNASRFWQRMRLRRRLPVYRQGLDAFDAFTCSTEPIAEALRRLRPGVPVHVVPNVPSARWIANGWERYGTSAWSEGGPRVLRYFPGSPSHDEDFATVSATLAALLHQHPELSLEIVGYLRFDARPFPSERISHRPRVPHSELPELLLSTWLNLIPLAPTPYSLARSNIKELEASAFDVPSVTGSPQDFRDRIEQALRDGR
ncbi:MAG TPA: hypothetical protein VLC09_16990 [Polyangiaceae bacterium]|nr:hypothetical protein [Polyangiaceae bacterium]